MKPSVKFGLINGGIGIVWAMLFFITGLNRSETGGYLQILGLIIPITCIVFAVKEYRAGEGNGWISYGKAFNIGFVITAIGAVIGNIYHYIFLNFIDPSFIDYQLNMQLEKMQEKGMSEEQISQSIAMTAKFMTPGYQFVFGMIMFLIIGVIIALIMAAILKKPNPDELS